MNTLKLQVLTLEILGSLLLTAGPALAHEEGLEIRTSAPTEITEICTRAPATITSDETQTATVAPLVDWSNIHVGNIR